MRSEGSFPDRLYVQLVYKMKAWSDASTRRQTLLTDHSVKHFIFIDEDSSLSGILRRFDW